MNESNRAVLRRYHEELSKDIIVTEELLGELYQVGVFHQDMIDIIRSQSPPDKIHKLLELLPKRGPDALDKFIGVIECSYPWLATILTSAQVKAPSKPPERTAAKTPGNSNSKGLSRSSLNLDDHHWNMIDMDIKRIVTAFVHRQFGQSKRISEKDKKSVERFVADQIQRERTRYQSVLTSTSSSVPSSPSTSSLDNVFQSTQVQEGLFSMHLKLERYIVRNNKTQQDGTMTTFSHDDDGHPNNRHQPQQQQEPSRTEELLSPKLMPEDMDFNLVSNEVDVVTKHVDLIEGTMNECLRYFDSRDRRHPLPSLVQNLVTRLEYQEDEMEGDRQQIKYLLDKVQNLTENTERLEKERMEQWKQIQAAHMDMASLRQEKCILQDRVNRLEKEKHQWQQEESNKRIGIVSKSIKTTPRGGQTHGGVGGVGSRNYTSGTGASVGGMVAVGISNEDGYARKNVTGTKVVMQRQSYGYLGYANRSRYGNVSNKKKGKTDYSSTNFNSTAKF